MIDHETMLGIVATEAVEAIAGLQQRPCCAAPSEPQWGQYPWCGHHYTENECEFLAYDHTGWGWYVCYDCNERNMKTDKQHNDQADLRP